MAVFIITIDIAGTQYKWALRESTVVSAAYHIRVYLH